MADTFVAYDPSKRACTAADRTLIKRLAGKRGSETKKKRLRLERACKVTETSQSTTNVANSRVASTSAAHSRQSPSQRGMAQATLHPHPATPKPEDRDLRLPYPVNNNFWAQLDAPRWPPMTTQPPAQTPRSWGDASTTPSISFGQPSNPTPTHLDPGGIGPQDYFSLQSDFKQPSFADQAHQGESADQPQQFAPRAFGSFDSGFQDSDAFGYDLTCLEEPSGLSPAAANFQYASHFRNVPDASSQHQGSSSRRGSAVRALHNSRYPFGQDDVDPFEKDAPSDTSKQSIFSPRRGPDDLAASQSRPSTWTERRPSSHCSPGTSEQSSWPNVDSVLARYVQYAEKQGQLDPGSASDCLNVLSEREEVRSLWTLNLSRVSPKLVLCSERPNEIYARAKARLQDMTPGQRMNVEGTLIKLGIVQYIAISLVVEVTSLEENVATRKGLGIWSKAETIVDHRMTGLVSGVQTISNSLWPDPEELEILRNPL